MENPARHPFVRDPLLNQNIDLSQYFEIKPLRTSGGIRGKENKESNHHRDEFTTDRATRSSKLFFIRKRY
jgi:hypothetical protein